MVHNSVKNFFNIFVSIFLCLLFPLSCFAQNFMGCEKVDDVYKKFAEIGYFKEYFKKNNICEKLSFEVKDKSGSVRTGCLIPLCNCEELKQCYDTGVQGYADADQMKLYGAGELKTDVSVSLCLLSPSSCSAENFMSREKVDDICKKFAEMDCFKECFNEEQYSRGTKF